MRILPTALLLIMTCALAAQTPANQLTGGEHNGRYWLELEPSNRTIFVVGFCAAVNAIGGRNVDTFLGEGSGTIGETVKGLDLFYDDPANAAIRIGDAFRVFAMKISGAAPDVLAVKTAALRRAAAAPAK